MRNDRLKKLIKEIDKIYLESPIPAQKERYSLLDELIDNYYNEETYELLRDGKIID